MKMDEYNQQDALLEKTLNQLPITPMPPDFVNQVMTRLDTVTAAHQPTTPIRFRLQFLDVVLALFWSATLVFVWLIILWGTGMIQFAWLPSIQPSFAFLEHLSSLNPTILIGGTMLFLLEIGLLGLIGLNLLGERPS